MSDEGRHNHEHDHGPPWGGPPWRGGPPWGGGKPPWWPEDESWPPRGPEAWRGMRRHFVRKFVVILGLFFAAIVGLSALIGALVFRGHAHARGPFIPLGIVLVVLAVFLIARAGRGFASPVADVMEAADRVAAGDYETRVQERGPREVQRLGRAFNEMAERLGTNENRRRQLLADVTHELRTPLSVIQANLEALIDGLYPIDDAHLRPVLEETKVMARLLDDLQTLSTAEAGVLTLHREPTTPGQLIDAAVQAFTAQAEEAGVRLEGRGTTTLPELEVDRLRIGEVVSNLLSNALRHTPAGGTIVVELHGTEDGVEFSIADTGTGIAPEQLPHVFDRFSRAPDSPGAGLGLTIAKTLVEAHGGMIRAESGPAGTTFVFTLPTSTK
jgi:two-component system, OmpR family, sensor histidine kinase BaeS